MEHTLLFFETCCCYISILESDFRVVYLIKRLNTNEQLIVTLQHWKTDYLFLLLPFFSIQVNLFVFHVADHKYQYLTVWVVVQTLFGHDAFIISYQDNIWAKHHSRMHFCRVVRLHLNFIHYIFHQKLSLKTRFYKKNITDFPGAFLHPKIWSQLIIHYS